MKRLPCIARGHVILTTAPSAADAADYAKKSSWAETMTAMRAVYLQSPEAQAAAARDSLFQPFDSGPLDGTRPRPAGGRQYRRPERIAARRHLRARGPPTATSGASRS